MHRIFAAIAVCLTGTAALAEEWVVKTSPHDVATTADRLEAVIAESPASLVARVDHQAAAAKAGLEMQPATVLIFGNPAMGTPLMQADPRVALDLPLKVLIWQDGEATSIGYLTPDSLAERYDLADTEELRAKVTQALDGLTDKAIAE